MKTYSLDRITSVADARAALGLLLPGSASPWVLCAEDGDVIAYFNVVESDIDLVGPAVTADISGRHFNEDAAVIVILKALQQKVGGVIASDV